MNKNKPVLLGAALVLVILVSSVVALIKEGRLNAEGIADFFKPEPMSETVEVRQFTSELEFREYLARVDQELGSGYYGATMRNKVSAMAEDSLSLQAPTAATAGELESSRYSQTNVQTASVDEPDIVKTDGENLFFAWQGQQDWVYREYDLLDSVNGAPDIDRGEEIPVEGLVLEEGSGESSAGSATTDVVAADIMPAAPLTDQKMVAPYYRQTNEVKLLTAFPPENLEETGTISDRYGDLLLAGDTLIVQVNNWGYYSYYDQGDASERGLYGYDVSDTFDPTQSWEFTLDDNASFVSTRLMGDRLFVLVQVYTDRNRPCPIRPMVSAKAGVMEIACTDIYYPVSPVNADNTYVLYEINAQTGDVTDKVSFVGGEYSTISYMSSEAMYVAYSLPVQYLDILLAFYRGPGAKLLPQSSLDRLERMNAYDISSQSKITEAQLIIEEYLQTLDDKEYDRVQKEMNDRMEDFVQERGREFVRSAVVKIPLDNLRVEATGDFPGTVLNQFSLDEYDGYLRVATTVGDMNGWTGSDSSVNDVYILDKDLDIVGEVTDMGKGEQIYSARFVGDKAYVVTFRQTDPFYVLDLSSPRDPQLSGELKIPGYSSYLHPIDANTVLGIGEERNDVKISLFDVSDPSDPVENDKVLLDEYWTDVNSTHHAFLQDSENEIFFLPAGQTGYVYSYADGKLEKQAKVTDAQAQRAIYIDDYLYVIGDDKIVVLDENTWEVVTELEMR